MRETVLRENKQRFLSALFSIFSISTLLAIPYTAFQYLDLQYRIQHETELRYTTSSYISPRDGSRITNYAYQESPWALAAKISSATFLIIPPLSAILISFVFVLASKESRWDTFFTAACITAAFLPINALTSLPWALIYWDGWEWWVGALLLLIESFIILAISCGLNGLRLFIRSLHKKHQT